MTAISVVMWATLVILAGAYSWSLVKAQMGNVIVNKIIEIQVPGTWRIQSPRPRNGRGIIQLRLANRVGFYVGLIRVTEGGHIIASLPIEDVKSAENLSRLATHHRLRWSSSLVALRFDCRKDDVEDIEIDLQLNVGIADDRLKQWHGFELPERARIVVREI